MFFKPKRLQKTGHYFWFKRFVSGYNTNIVVCRGGSRIFGREQDLFTNSCLYMWRFSGRIFMPLSSSVFFEYEFSLFTLSFLLLSVPNLFENNFQSSWWSTCLMPVFCNQAKIHVATNQERKGARPGAPRLNPPSGPHVPGKSKPVQFAH